MIINPQKILDDKVVTAAEGEAELILDPKNSECQLQQNGVDLRLSKAYLASGFSRFTIRKANDHKCSYEEMIPDQVGYLYFRIGQQYALDFAEYVDIPENMCAYLFMRSSINRYSGTFLTALYDAGFRGRIGGIYRPTIDTTIEVGCRIAQIVFIESDSHRLYTGQYQDQKSQV